MKKGQRSKPAPRIKGPSLFVAIPLVLISIFIVCATIYKITEFILKDNSSANFPKLELFLKDAPIEQIDASDKNIKYQGNTANLIIDGNSTTYTDVEIKGHGNSTWMNTYKKPYQIKLAKKSSLFSIDKSRKWILLANHFDPTYVRTSLAYFLESILDTEYPLSGHHVELYIDNVYRGLYYLSEKVEIDENRVNLTDPFGVIAEMDNLRGTSSDCFYTQNGECFLLHDSVNKDNKITAMNTFINEFNKLELAIKEKDFKTIESLIDIDSFATYFLLNEFLINRDAYSTSFFFYKDGKTDKIHAGPAWDFDLCIGGVNDTDDFSHLPSTTMSLKELANSASKKSSPEAEPTSHAETISTIIYDLMEIPEFELRVKEIYQQTISKRGQDIIDYVKSQVNYIQDAVLRDHERWKSKSDFNSEVNHLINWIKERYNHFEELYS